MSTNWKSQPKTGHSRFENIKTQPLRTERNFANFDVLLEGWYPVNASATLKAGEARSVVIGKQRIAIWRGDDNVVRAIDAFCPHMGADLGNGTVVGDQLRCYFHHWQLDGNGEVKSSPCTKKNTSNVKVNSYPVREYLGHIWVYAGTEVRTPLIVPPGLEGKPLHALRLLESKLFAHHHVMIAGGIDLQHFSTVHNIDIDFDYDLRDEADSVIQFRMSGLVGSRGWRGKLGKWLVGDSFTYRMRVGSGSMVSITYGEKLHVLWGCVPTEEGVSRVVAFSVTERKSGFLGSAIAYFKHALTLALLLFLKDDDVKAFPNMRFSLTNPMPEDKPVLELIHAINQMPESIWTAKQAESSKSSVLNIGL